MDFMKDVHEMCVEFVFDKAVISDHANMPIADWGAIRDQECNDTRGTFMRQLMDEQESRLRDFVALACDKMKDIRFIWRQDLAYKVICNMKAINGKGQHADCDYTFIDNRTGKTLAVVNVECKGGKFGTFTNLLGDSMKDSTKKVVNLMKKYHKK